MEIFESELKIPIVYKNKVLESDFRCDFYVENTVVVELKATQEFHGIHEAQVLNYMQLLKSPKGILINFNGVAMSDIIKRQLLKISRNP